MTNDTACSLSVELWIIVSAALWLTVVLLPCFDKISYVLGITGAFGAVLGSLLWVSPVTLGVTEEFSYLRCRRGPFTLWPMLQDYHALSIIECILELNIGNCHCMIIIHITIE